MHCQDDPLGTTPIRRELIGPRQQTIDGDHAPRPTVPASPRKPPGLLDLNPNTRERAISNLKRSGYRPLIPVDDCHDLDVSGRPGGWMGRQSSVAPLPDSGLTPVYLRTSTAQEACP
jgi:hypothetical protein